ncbi:MAG TPA: transglycosylase SLT domain-containing protein [Bryobacteraceae bacterium]|nr:transglycosylase SLT domain-containing protein [Bryobacteraceae bacterium]
MTLSHRSWFLTISVLIPTAFLLTGCISGKPQAFGLSFLPSTPVPVEIAYEEPPQLPTGFYSNDTPDLIQHALTTMPRPPEVDGRIVRAEDHFEAGRKLYQQGDFAAARREFDAAVDILLSTPENLPDRQKLERRLDQMVDRIYHYDLDRLGSGETQQEVVYDKPPLGGILEMTFPTDPNLRPKVKEEIEATVSQLPLEENDAVLSYIHYFSTERGRKSLLAGLRHAGRYRALIQRVLDDEGVPQELIYLAQAESGFLPRARSYKKAVGMWQFVQFRGREYGLNQTAITDDRMDPERATRAAARHLHDLYVMFGDWYLAMAAYNCGPGCVDHAVQRTGFADFWELRDRNALPRDTKNYVPLILAITIMAKNPKDYNLEDVDLDPPVEYDTITVDSPTSLSLIADATDRPVTEIQELNPALMKPVAPAGYQVRVPKGASSSVVMALDIIPAAHRANWRIHRVTNGETLAEIAKHYATPVAAISTANQGMSAAPEAGDLLVIPAGYHVERAVPHRTSTTAHRKIARPAAASHRRVAAAPQAAPSASSPYKAASLTVEHPATVN